MLFHSLLASIIFAEKSTIYYFVGVPLELINHFALEAFKIFFFLSSVFDIFTIMCLWISLRLSFLEFIQLPGCVH